MPTSRLTVRNTAFGFFDGIVTQAKWSGVGESGNKYALTLRLWAWIASRRRNQRIFHNRTVEQILEELLKPYAGQGDPALLLKLTKDYPVLEYTVQYRESDRAFATRLMERFGISYHFVHALRSHTMVLTDDVQSHDAVVGGSRDYKAAFGAAQTGREHFWEWHPERRMTTGAMRLTEYNFKTPNATQEVGHTGDAAYARGDIESFDWPGDYLEQDAGRGVAALRTDQERGQDRRHRAVGDCTSLGSGMKLTLPGDQVNGVGDAEYLCVVTRHAYTSDGYGSGAESADDGFAYTGEYVFMPADAPLAPERKTQVPAVHGPQTAVVVGEGEIDCDEYGRILVHFHWDLDAAFSMRCRVSQNWAAKGWGGMVIPRIGMEVVVEFLEGDPDKPLVTGCVYNGKNDVRYSLPEHKTRSTFRTDTYQGEGFNELRFEDEKDQEEIFVHAQRDRNTKIERNFSERITRNAIESVGHNKSSEISNTLRQMVGGDLHMGVGPGKIGTIVPSGAARNTQGIGQLAEGMGDVGRDPGVGNLIISVEASKFQKIEAHLHETVGDDKTSTVGGNYRFDVEKSIEITAGDSITIKVGKSLMTMDDAGNIAINGRKIAVTMDQLLRIMADLVRIN